MAQQKQAVDPAIANVPFPEKLELSESSENKHQEWTLFKQVFQNYEISSGLVHHEDRRRVATLLTCFSQSALRVFNSLTFGNEGESMNMTAVLEKMDEACKGVVNETFERYKFNTNVRKESEDSTRSIDISSS